MIMECISTYIVVEEFGIGKLVFNVSRKEILVKNIYQEKILTCLKIHSEMNL